MSAARSSKKPNYYPLLSDFYSFSPSPSLVSEGGGCAGSRLEHQPIEDPGMSEIAFLGVAAAVAAIKAAIIVLAVVWGAGSLFASRCAPSSAHRGPALAPTGSHAQRA